MPEHVHLLVVPGDTTVSKLLMGFKRRSATLLLRAWRETNDPRLAMAAVPDGSHRFWQAGGGYDRNIVDGPELPEKMRYIHANPVRRVLVGRPSDWLWSSARAWEGLDTPWPEIDRP